jgi:amidophosphoribosyltransferase
MECCCYKILLKNDRYKLLKYPYLYPKYLQSPYTMSESIKHECGVALIRLLKPLEYYHEKYGTAFYGLNKLHLLMQKQRNRGQDGAGIATIKLDPLPGHRYISRKRSNSAQQPIRELFEQVFLHFKDLPDETIHSPQYLKDNFPYMGELLMGHLRYGTHGANTIEQVHPFLRPNNWISRNLLLAGNFNMTNVDELFNFLVEDLGQHPKEKSDTVTVLEKIGHFLDDEVQHWFNYFKRDNYSNKELTALITEHLDVHRILRRASKDFDGGFVLMGMIGHGDAFVMRDPNGIRPAYYYQDDEIVAVASERPAIQTSLNVNYRLIKELEPAHALIIKKDGRVTETPFVQVKERKACSFERIYFSRGTDRDIYLERKKLGEQLAEPIMKMVGYDFENTVFSFIPNTAETAFMGFTEELHNIYNRLKSERIQELHANGDFSTDKLNDILRGMPRIEKLAVKDDKARTFITADNSRDEMVSHVYDVTYGIVKDRVDTLVLLDDSIVRGTTLKNSIIRIMARLKPKKIIIVSSAPQIRYPDCYGIDMSKMGDFVAFQALIKLIHERGFEEKLDHVYDKCKTQEHLPKTQVKNYVQELYDLFSYEDITKKIAEIVTPDNIEPEVEVLYQTLEGLAEACPNNTGNWYFSGNYPTPGGNKVVNKAFINFMEKKNVRAY